MRISKLAAAALRSASPRSAFRPAPSRSTPTVSRYQAMPAPQGQTFFVVPGGGMAANGGLEFQRYAGHRRPAARRPAATRRRPARRARTWSSSSATASTAARSGIVEDPFYGTPLSATAASGSAALLSSALRLSAAAAILLRLERSVLVRRRRIDSYVEYHSQIDLHIRAGRHQRAAVRRPRPGALADQPARRRRPEPGRSDVHRLPGPQRRDGQDHHPDAGRSAQAAKR